MKRHYCLIAILFWTAAMCEDALAFELNLPPEKQAAVARVPVKQSNASGDTGSGARSFDTTGDKNSEFDPGIGRSAESNLAAMVSNTDDLTQGRGSRYTEADHASNAVAQYKARQPATSEKAQTPAH